MHRAILISLARRVLRSFAIYILLVMLLLAFYASIPQPEFTEETEMSSEVVYTYKVVSAKTVYNRIITVRLNENVSAAQVTISTWFWVVHAAVHIFVDGREVAQINTGASGSANSYVPLPHPVRELTIVVWAHNMAPIPLDFHASVALT